MRISFSMMMRFPRRRFRRRREAGDEAKQGRDDAAGYYAAHTTCRLASAICHGRQATGAASRSWSRPSPLPYISASIFDGACRRRALHCIDHHYRLLSAAAISRAARASARTISPRPPAWYRHHMTNITTTRPPARRPRWPGRSPR